VQQTIELQPDSVTIYQMELPYNTTISKDLLKGAKQLGGSLAGWSTKRRWVEDAFEALERAGYHVGSAYTAVKDPGRTTFLYRDRLWQGADMAALGVASFGHINGVHMQNRDTWEAYSAAIDAGELALARAYRPTDEERMRRELVLQLKLGRIAPTYFQTKYGVDILRHFADQWRTLKEEGYLAQADGSGVALTRAGLMRVDALLPRFFLPQHTNIRYT
jgi:oxygen-independent coproporphyrinogen-3 oxidase